MVFGRHLLENIQRLAPHVSVVEIVLFHTPELHNIPSPEEIRELRSIGRQEGLAFTVHLPASLEFAAQDPAIRKNAVALANQICACTEEFSPEYYVFHIPYTPPTLAPVPGLYFKPGQGENWPAWTQRAMASLQSISVCQRSPKRWLVENINYAPDFLAPFWTAGPCRMCLDIGHLLLGGEDVCEQIRHCAPALREIHLHGVRGWEEHIDLGVRSTVEVRQWLYELHRVGFQGIVNLEVFSPEDFHGSLKVLADAWAGL